MKKIQDERDQVERVQEEVEMEDEHYIPDGLDLDIFTLYIKVGHLNFEVRWYDIFQVWPFYSPVE